MFLVSAPPSVGRVSMTPNDTSNLVRLRQLGGSSQVGSIECNDVRIGSISKIDPTAPRLDRPDIESFAAVVVKTSCVAVLQASAFNSCTVHVGWNCLSRAIMPATRGVADEVPLKFRTLLPLLS